VTFVTVCSYSPSVGAMLMAEVDRNAVKRTRHKAMRLLRHYESEARSAGLSAASVLLEGGADRKSTRLNSSHANISYAVFCLKKKKPSNTYTLPI